MSTSEAGAIRRIETILDSIAAPVVGFDKTWRYTYVSSRAALALGKNAEAMQGRSMWDVFPGDGDARFRAACLRAWAEGKSVNIERYCRILGKSVENHICRFDDEAVAEWTGTRQIGEETAWDFEKSPVPAAKHVFLEVRDTGGLKTSTAKPGSSARCQFSWRFGVRSDHGRTAALVEYHWHVSAALGANGSSALALRRFER